MPERPKPVVITIDGPAASGKGTLARRICAETGFAHLDTGSLYRAVALGVLRAGAPPGDRETALAVARSLEPSISGQDDPQLREEEVGNTAGEIAAYPEVRQALTDFQRNFAARPPGGANGAVLDGRDTGTVICPEADLKFFLDANLRTRMHRRARELRDRGGGGIVANVLRDMEKRDKRDRSRTIAPLVPAADALVLDTTHMDADAVFTRAMELIRSLTLERRQSCRHAPDLKQPVPEKDRLTRHEH